MTYALLVLAALLCLLAAIMTVLPAKMYWPLFACLGLAAGFAGLAHNVAH